MEREPRQASPKPPLTVVASARLNLIDVCEICGAGIVQRFDDVIDRDQQHKDWHQRLDERLDWCDTREPQ